MIYFFKLMYININCMCIMDYYYNQNKKYNYVSKQQSQYQNQNSSQINYKNIKLAEHFRDDNRCIEFNAVTET